MIGHLVEDKGEDSIAIQIVSKKNYGGWLSSQSPFVAGWIRSQNFSADAGDFILLPDQQSGAASVVFIPDDQDPWCWSRLAASLPKGLYRLADSLSSSLSDWAALGWALALYRFDRYKKTKPDHSPLLIWPKRADRERITSTIEAIFLVRDLINLPANDLGPEELADAAATLADKKGAAIKIISGDQLLDENYPLIHAVGQGSNRPPRLIDLHWGEESHPKVTLIGKGVCFDTGGLDLKSAANMKLMKKDMGGAAHVLGLASMIIDAGLPIRLRVLIPAVENSVSGPAMRPQDVLKSRKGLSVEIGNTDAEGRLVLADCLAEAGREKPDMIIDVATLTGAARVALGPDLPALFTPSDDLASDILIAAASAKDPVWRLPLWKPYRRMLDSKIADINNSAESSFAGAITAALFLSEFVPAHTSWAHLDVLAWNHSSRPGRPEGGEAMGLRTLFHMIARKYPL